VLRGIWGVHGHHEPHGDKLFQLTRHVPVVTIVIDSPRNIADRVLAEGGHLVERRLGLRKGDGVNASRSLEVDRRCLEAHGELAVVDHPQPLHRLRCRTFRGYLLEILDGAEETLVQLRVGAQRPRSSRRRRRPSRSMNAVIGDVTNRNRPGSGFVPIGA
jgi:hypothetical protein